MFKLFSEASKKSLPTLNRLVNAPSRTSQPFRFYAAKSNKDIIQAELVRNGKKLFEDNYGPERVSDYNKVTISTYTPLINTEELTPDKTGVFMALGDMFNHAIINMSTGKETNVLTAKHDALCPIANVKHTIPDTPPVTYKVATILIHPENIGQLNRSNNNTDPEDTPHKVKPR